MHIAARHGNGKYFHDGNVIRLRMVSSTLPWYASAPRTFTTSSKCAGKQSNPEQIPVPTQNDYEIQRKSIGKVWTPNSLEDDLGSTLIRPHLLPAKNKVARQSQNRERRGTERNLGESERRGYDDKLPSIRRYGSQRDPLTSLPFKAMTEMSSAYPVQNNEITRNKFLQSSQVTKEEVIDRALRIAVRLADVKRKTSQVDNNESPATTIKVTRYDMNSPHNVAESWSRYFEGRKKSEGELAIDNFARYLSPEFVPDQDLFLGSSETDKDMSEDYLGVDSSITYNSPMKAQSQESKSVAFDILNTVGLDLENSMRGELSTILPDEELGSTGDSNKSHRDKETQVSDKDYKIQWDSLPLSPLLHQKLIDARNQFRLAKLSPKCAPGYDENKGNRVSNDYIAQMLATPIRVCRFTNSRLPTAFLLPTHAVKNPKTNALWELPNIPEAKRLRSNEDVDLESEIRQEFLGQSRIDPQRRIEEDEPEAKDPQQARRVYERDFDEKDKILREESPRFLALSDQVHPTPENSSLSALPNHQQGSDAELDDCKDTELGTSDATSTTSKSRPKHVKVQQRHMSSYILFTSAITDAVTNLSSKTYTRSIPQNWRQKVEISSKSAMCWRADTSDVILRLMQAYIVSLLKPLRSYARHGLVGTSISVDGHQKHETTLPSPFNSSVLLYLGPTKIDTKNNNHDNTPSFSQAIKTLAECHSLETHSILFIKSQPKSQQDTPSHSIRLRKPEDKGGGSIISYDLTQILSPEQLHNLHKAGFEEPMYYIADFAQSRMFRKGMFMLAHYIGRSNTSSSSSSS